MTIIRSMKPDRRWEHVDAILRDYANEAASTGLNEPEPLLKITYEYGDRKTLFAYPAVMHPVHPWGGGMADMLVVVPRNGSKRQPIGLSLATILDIEVGRVEE